MRLNPDCIRDILLTAEDICDFDTPWKHDKDQPLGERLEKYPYDEVLYHLSQAGKAGLLENVRIYDELDCFFVSDIAPAGHEFLANIRNDSFFNKVKDIGLEIGTTSLQNLTQIAAASAAMLIKAHFNLP